MKLGDKAAWVGDLAQDLLQRKVDTIVTDGITGRAMPHPIIALLDINNTYLRKLMTLRVVDPENPDLPADAHDDKNWLFPNVAAQKWLVSKALDGLKRQDLKTSDRAILQRIVATCTELMPIVARLEKAHSQTFGAVLRDAKVTSSPADPKAQQSRQYYAIDWSNALPDLDHELERQEHAALSKAWELGSATVALQTISMLDGDIISHVTEQYAGDAGAVIRQIHKEAVNLSFTTWEVLAKSIGSFVEALFGRK